MTTRCVAISFDQHSGIIEVVIADQLDVVEHSRHPPIIPCELPDGIQFVYLDNRGRRQAIALDEAGEVDFGRARSFRQPPAYLSTQVRRDTW